MSETNGDELLFNYAKDLKDRLKRKDNFALIETRYGCGCGAP